LTRADTLLHFPGCPRGRLGKVPASDRKESLRRIPRKRKSSKSRGLWCVERPFSCRLDGSVLENSTACVYVETRSLAIWFRTNPVWFSFGRTDFEHKLKVTNCRPLA
jgi:hypothetical protein